LYQRQNCTKVVLLNVIGAYLKSQLRDDLTVRAKSPKLRIFNPLDKADFAWYNYDMKVAKSWRQKQLVQQYFKSQILKYREQGKSYREIANLINKKHIPYSKFKNKVTISKDIVARIIKQNEQKKDNKLIDNNNNYLAYKALSKYKKELLKRFKDLEFFSSKETILKNLYKNFNINILKKEPKFNEINIKYNYFKKFILENLNG